MTALNGSFEAEDLYRVLSTPPVLNKRTILTSIMEPAQPQLMALWTRPR